MSRFLGALSVLGLCAAGWFSTVLARAGREFRTRTAESIARASSRLPLNTEYLSRDALQTEYNGGDPRSALRRMVELTPFASAPRIRLGLDAEARGDFGPAERWLLDAARVDRQFEPAWTLANFYFRRESPEPFWKWIHAALEVSYGDRTPAFDLCWNSTGDAGAILNRAIPDRPEVTSAYVVYLLERRKTSALEAAAVKLGKWSAEYRPLLDQAADALIDARDYDAAAAVWTAAGGRMEENFADAGHGFDWRFIEVPGVRHVATDSVDAHRIELSGQQPESAELMRRYINLARGGELTWEARTSGFPSATGLAWTIGEESAALAASDDWKPGAFEARGQRGWALLTLRYQRPAGETRAEGFVEIRNVRVGAGK